VFYNNTVLEVSDTWEGEGTHVLDGPGEVDVTAGFDLRNGKHILGLGYR
jgi:hypothetical protein